MRAIIAAMDAMVQPPAATAFDAAASVMLLLLYIGVAVAAIARTPRDARAQLFLALAVTSAAPYALSPLQWLRGAAAYTPFVIAVTAVSFAVGSVALFHFTQVFPWRRPWIRAHGLWLAAAYVVLPLPVAFIAWFLGSVLAPVANGAGGLGAVSAGVTVSLVLLLIIPGLFLVGLVLPFAGVMSLFSSWREARKAADAPARITTLWMLISQMAGGVLAALVAPLLHLVGVNVLWSSVVGALTYACGVLMPLSFAAAVWRYRMLNTSA